MFAVAKLAPTLVSTAISNLMETTLPQPSVSIVGRLWSAVPGVSDLKRMTLGSSTGGAASSSGCPFMTGAASDGLTCPFAASGRELPPGHPKLPPGMAPKPSVTADAPASDAPRNAAADASATFVSVRRMGTASSLSTAAWSAPLPGITTTAMAAGCSGGKHDVADVD